MGTVIIIQARMGSSRLPGKVLLPLCGKPMLWHIVQRARRVTNARVIIATSITQKDDVVSEYCCQNSIECFRGSEDDVLERYYRCACQYGATRVVRLTCDNPLVDPALIEKGIQAFAANPQLDYMKYREGLPLGMHTEIFTFTALKCAFFGSSAPPDREHVTRYMYTCPKGFHAVLAPLHGENHAKLRWTVDTPEDYRLITAIYDALYPGDIFFGYQQILASYERHPEWLSIN